MPSAKKEPKVEPSTDVHTNMCHCTVVRCPPQQDQFFFSDDRMFSVVDCTLTARFSSNSDPLSSFSPPAHSATHLQTHFECICLHTRHTCIPTRFPCTWRTWLFGGTCHLLLCLLQCQCLCLLSDSDHLQGNSCTSCM